MRLKEEMAWQEEKRDSEERLHGWGAGPIGRGLNQRHSHTLTV